MSAINYSDINTKGFVVVPNVINQEHVDRILIDYRRARNEFDQKKITNRNYNMLYSGPHKVVPDLASVVDSINVATGMNIDLISGIGSYFDSSILTFGWHQDHEPCYMWQMSDAYVNFWIPLIKPDRSQAGLRIMPFDVLEEKTSRAFVKENILGKGAQNFISTGKEMHITNADLNQTYSANVVFDELCVVPDVGPGDAIIMRGDCIHQTHRTHTHRVAISIKALNCSNRVVTKEKFLNNSPSKTETISKNKNDYAIHLRRFVDENVDSFPLKELFPKAPIHYSLIKR